LRLETTSSQAAQANFVKDSCFAVPVEFLNTKVMEHCHKWSHYLQILQEQEEGKKISHSLSLFVFVITTHACIVISL
jgi:hypothetical protein